MRTQTLAPAVVLLAVTLGACGSSGGSKASFSDQLQDACRTVARGLRDVDQPTSLDDFQKSADDASSVYQDGVTALKKLKAPSKQASDFNDLQSNMNDEVDLFDQISSSAKKGDDKTVTTKISSLKKLDGDNADLADSLGAELVAFESVFTAGPVTTDTVDTTPDTTPDTVDTTPGTTPDTAPETTRATTPATRPTTTLPPTTVATTLPATTAPPVTAAPTTAAAGSNKTIITLADQMTPAGDYSFVDSANNTVTLIQTAMDANPIIAVQPGTLFGVDVVVDDIPITRVFGFLPDAESLTPGSVEALQTTLAGSNPVTAATIAEVSGGTFTSAGNLFFVAEKGGTMVIVVAKDENSLETGFADFVDSVGN